MGRMRAIKIAAGILFFLCCFSYCSENSTTHQSPPSAIQTVRIITSIPIGATDKSVFYYTDSILITEHKGFRLFQLFTMHTSNFLLGEKEDGSPQSKSTTSKISSVYFVTRPNEVFGFLINAESLDVKGRSPLDSFYKKKGLLFGVSKIYESDKSNSRLLESQKRGNETIEKYSPLKKNDGSFSDTMYYYYSTTRSLTEIEFSMSPEQDTLGMGKMYKVVGKYNGNLKAKNPLEQLERYISVEMTPALIESPELIKRICNKAKMLFEKH